MLIILTFVIAIRGKGDPRSQPLQPHPLPNAVEVVSKIPESPSVLPETVPVLVNRSLPIEFTAYGEIILGGELEALITLLTHHDLEITVEAKTTQAEIKQTVMRSLRLQSFLRSHNVPISAEHFIITLQVAPPSAEFSYSIHPVHREGVLE